MKSTVLKYGLISGAIISVLMMLTIPLHDQIGFGISGMVVGYTTMVMALLLVYFGVRSYRDTVGGGTVRFGRALQVGALIAVISCLCYVATWEVMYFKFMPDFMDKYSANEVEVMRGKGATPAELAAKKEELDKYVVMYKNPVYNAGMTFMEPLPVALLVAFISAGVLSRSKKREDGGDISQLEPA